LHDYTFGDSEMLCKEGRQDFDLCTAAGFVDPPDLCLCLSALPPWNSLCTLASLLKIMVNLSTDVNTFETVRENLPQ